MGTWTITSFWAWSTGRRRGLDVLTAILDVANATGTVLLLNAANRRLAVEYYLSALPSAQGRSRQSGSG
jgi:hypothetical protein